MGRIVKEERLFSTQASLSLAILYYLINTVEEAIEEYDINPNDLTLGWGLIDDIRESPWRIRDEKEKIIIYNKNLVDRIDLSRQTPLGMLNIEIAPGESNISFTELYKLIISIIRKDSFEFAVKASYTTKTGIEFIFNYLDNGKIAMFEGEHFRVRLPFIHAIASVHTHPQGACGLSRADIESAIDLLAEGGLLSGAATPSCMVFIYRRFMFSEEDYIRLKEFINLRNKSLKDLNLTTVAFGIIRY